MVHGRCTVVHFTDLVTLSGVVQDSFCCRGLSGVNVRHDPDISGALKWELTLGHYRSLPFDLQVWGMSKGKKVGDQVDHQR
jgi:hypothetical protein